MYIISAIFSHIVAEKLQNKAILTSYRLKHISRYQKGQEGTQLKLGTNSTNDRNNNLHYQQYLSSLNVRVLFCWVVSLEFSECSSSRPLPSPSTQATLYFSSWNLDEDTYNDKEQYTCDEKLVSTSNVIKTKKGNNFPWLLLHSQFYLLRYITVEQHGEEDWDNR